MKNVFLISVKNIVVGVCVTIVVLATASFFLVGARKAPGFLRNIEVAFESGKNDFSFHDLTDFEWDEVCFFSPINDEPESAYWAYQRYLDESSYKEAPLERKNYSAIFIFRKGSVYHQMGFKRGYVRINQKKFWPRINGEETSPTGGCLKGDVFIKKEDLSVLKIYNKGY